MSAILFVTALRSFSLLFISARILKPEEFGALAIIIGLCGLFHGLASIPSSDTITTFVPQNTESKKSPTTSAILFLSFCGSLGISIFISVLLVVCALAGKHLVNLEQSHILALLVYNLVHICLATQFDSWSILRLVKHLHLALAAALAGLLVQTAALCFVYQWSDNLLHVTLAVLAGAVVSGGGQLSAVLWLSRNGTLPEISGRQVLALPKNIFRFHLLGFIQLKVQTLHEYLPVILLGGLVGSIQAGIYHGARQIINLLLFPLYPISQSIYTEYSKRWQANGSFGRFPWTVSLLLTGLMTCGVGLLFLLFPWVIRIVLGPDYENVSGPLLALLPGAWLFACVSLLHPLPLAMGQRRPMLKWNMMALTMQLFILFLLLPRYQAVGAALAYSTFHLVLTAMVIFFAITSLPRQKSGSVQRAP